MTIERPMFPPRAGNSLLRIVGGIDSAPSPESEPAPAPSPRQRKFPYKDRQPIEYQDGLPVIDPAGEDDPIFFEIARHREAIGHYDRCIDLESEAEEKLPSHEALYHHLQASTKQAFDNMILMANCVILCRPTTRRGLIHQVRYLASQFTEPHACNSGGPYLPDNIGENPWQLAFLRSLAAGLRKMGAELDAPKQGVQR